MKTSFLCFFVSLLLVASSNVFAQRITSNSTPTLQPSLYLRNDPGTSNQSGQQFGYIFSNMSNGIMFQANTIGIDANTASGHMVINSSGNVGIGTKYPESNLHIMGRTGENTSIKLTHQNEGARSSQIMFDHDHGSTGGGIGRITSSWWNDPVMMFQLARDVSNRGFSFKNNAGSELVRIVHTGNVGIGTTSPSNKLDVAGTIRAEEVKVEAAPWPDYVFSDTYELSSLSEVSEYISENGHLPNIPSASEVEENGIKLGEMNAKLLEKIEELTLYLIGQNQKIEILQKENIEQNKIIKNFLNK